MQRSSHIGLLRLCTLWRIRPPPRPRTRSKTRDARDPPRPCGVRSVHWSTFVDRTTRSGLSSKMQSRRRSSPTRAAERTSLSMTCFLSMTVMGWSCQRWQKKLRAAPEHKTCGSRWRSFRGRAVSVGAVCLEARCRAECRKGVKMLCGRPAPPNVRFEAVSLSTVQCYKP